MPNVQVNTVDTEPIMVSVEEAGRLLGIRRWRAYELVNAGIIPSVRLGERCIRVPVKALEERMNAMAEEGRTA